MHLAGDWSVGAIQKVLVTMLALRMEAAGLHPSHSSAVRYQDTSILFLGGESNHGKSMGQIEACRRGGLLISTETTVIDEDIRAVMGSKSVFLREKRAKGTERADKAAPTQGVSKFWGDMPTWEEYAEVSRARSGWASSRPSSRRSIRSRTTSSPTSCWHRAFPCP
jgi:hypothetical protein